jgi:hypothetical protein
MDTPTVPNFTTPLQQYVWVAEHLFQHNLSTETLSDYVACLPIIRRPLFNDLTRLAETAVFTQPAYAYALMTVADVAAQHSDDLFLRGLAAWQLARAANAWVRPQLVETAVSRAHTLFTQLHEPGWFAACA